ncbi:hypothetical protein [Hyphomicrobium facile]|uniref:hypothetical protein n=1 Tax=Hyphomicrobium facile TaxID=51670 RepID=UPI000B84D6C1|nr:hypothetical protein [Hyphomicrobium facile]
MRLVIAIDRMFGTLELDQEVAIGTSIASSTTLATVDMLSGRSPKNFGSTRLMAFSANARRCSGSFSSRRLICDKIINAIEKGNAMHSVLAHERKFEQSELL